MRTDSLNLSALAIGTISSEIKSTMGEQYLKVRKWHTTSKGAQEAHEAIRPTFISNHDISGTAQEKKLYNLIWKRTIASQMADAQLEKTTVDITISNRAEHFTASGEMVKFDGFLKVYTSGDDDESDDTPTLLPKISKGAILSTVDITGTERFTQQPPRYTEASLVRKLEELGIGRPSTYAPTISTIQEREYVEKGEKKGQKRNYEIVTLKNGKISSKSKSELTGAEKGKLIPTDTGLVVNDFLTKYFPSVLDYNFTAKMESEFDNIAEGKSKWNDEIAKFYNDFHPDIEKVMKMRMEHKVGERTLGTDPATGKPVMVKIGRFGPIAQIGSSDDKEKPRFASLQKGQSVATITLQEALKLFEMPRTLGTLDGADVQVAIGRFGPYVKHNSTFASIPKEMSPYTITLEEATSLLSTKRESQEKKVINRWEQEPDLQVLNGRYGPYIAYGKKNFKIPKGKDAKKLTLEDCLAIVGDEKNATRPNRGRKS